jgi:glycerophosphoryl diester phosphodiesterase
MSFLLAWLLATSPAAPVEIIAHRGESSDAPENTLAAFNLAWKRGVPGVELDVHLTKDDQLAVIHDADTKRVCAVNKVIKESTLGELQTLDVGTWKDAKFAGERIPSLEQALATVPDGHQCFIEVKVGPEAVPALVKAVNGFGKSPEQLVIISFKADTIAEAKKQLPHLKAYWLFKFKKDEQTGEWTARIEDLISEAKRIQADGLNLSFEGPWDESLVAKVRDAKLSLYVWTVDDVAVARRMVALDVDGITTNKGEWLRQQLEQQSTASSQPSDDRPRVIVETDAGGDPDDEQSMVRFLVYANDLDVEGIIVNRVLTRDGENLNPERTGYGVVRRMVKAYGECAERLREHDPRYPTAEEMLERTVNGDNAHEDGVDLIIRAVDADDPRPVWLLNWGTDHGSDESSLKRALDRVLKERGQEGYAKFKSRVFLSSDDQFDDHTFKIEPAFPLWVDTFRPEIDRRRWYHRFSAITATAGGFDIENDVRTGHGPLGEMYPLNTTHTQKEGDTMTFTYLIPTGMNDPLHPGWGSWAGRYGKMDDAGDRNYFWANQQDTWNGSTSRENTLARWAADLQNDFKARMDWCVQPKDKANHPPKIVLTGERERTIRDGEPVTIDASRSSDPDGDELMYSWEVYREAGTCQEPVEFLDKDADGAVVTIDVPTLKTPADVHLVLTARDNGTPPLTRYARVVLHVEPPNP